MKHALSFLVVGLLFGCTSKPVANDRTPASAAEFKCITNNGPVSFFSAKGGFTSDWTEFSARLALGNAEPISLQCRGKSQPGYYFVEIHCSPAGQALEGQEPLTFRYAGVVDGLKRPTLRLSGTLGEAASRYVTAEFAKEYVKYHVAAFECVGGD